MSDPCRESDFVLRETRRADGRPLVAGEAVLLPQRLPPEPVGTAPRIWPFRRASPRAAVSTMGPRAVLTTMASDRMEAKASASMRWRVRSVSGV